MIQMYDGAAVPSRQSVTAIHFCSLYACYGGDSGVVQFWRAGDALLYALGGTLHIDAPGGLDREELKAFVGVMGFRRIYCTEVLAADMHWRPQSVVHELAQRRRCADPMPGAVLKLSEIYAVLSAAGGAIEMPPFADFCVDFSHRLRHGGARCVGDRRGVAITTGETEKLACIGGVAVLPEHRKTGYGRRLVQSLCAALQKEGKTVFTSTVEPLLPFYTGNGFAELQRCCYCTQQT